MKRLRAAALTVAALLALGGCLGGCAGPADRTLPRQPDPDRLSAAAAVNAVLDALDSHLAET